MKFQHWWLHLPVIIIFTLCFFTLDLSEKGTLSSPFLRKHFIPTLRSWSGLITNNKFKLRGPIPPKNKIVIVEIDNESIDTIGRWPWRRDIMAALIHEITTYNPKAIGLDIVFSEPENLIPEELKESLKGLNLNSLYQAYETDLMLQAEIQKNQNQIILGWASQIPCQPPAYEPKCAPLVVENDENKIVTDEFEKFQIANFNPGGNFNPTKAPLNSVVELLPNTPEIAKGALHAGSFDITPDADGFVRRVPLFQIINGKPYPSLPLEMALVGLNEELFLSLNDKMFVKEFKWKNNNKTISTSPQGFLDINFRGPAYTFTYVPAIDLLDLEKSSARSGFQKDKIIEKKDAFKDAYVLIGLSATAVYDMRAFPFDHNVPGVEGHASILDNLLSNDAFSPPTTINTIIIILLMTVGAFYFALFIDKLKAFQSILFFLAIFGSFFILDFQLFKNNINLNFSFLFLEISIIFVLKISVKWLLEEKNKKFIKDAFSKYVSKAVVESIIKNPHELSLGGKKEDLTILFSDIRGFTTISEKMDAKQLAAFLNDYLGEMTQIIFDYEGTLDKFIGDAVMAFWGAPLQQSDHAYRCTQAAIKMIQKLREIQPKIYKDYNIHIEIGIGVHSGLVNVGNMGSERNFNYTVIGDDVNLASRLEGLTKYYGCSILTTRATYDSIQKSGKSPPPGRCIDFVKVKGKANAVEIIQPFDRAYDSSFIKTFEEAQKFYLEQNWNSAIQAFKEALSIERQSNDKLLKSDVACQIFIERCKKFKESPPNSDWDGSWEMTSK